MYGCVVVALEEMHPTVEVVGNAIKVRLSKNDSMRVADSDALSVWVN